MKQLTNNSSSLILFKESTKIASILVSHSRTFVDVARTKIRVTLVINIID